MSFSKSNSPILQSYELQNSSYVNRVAIINDLDINHTFPFIQTTNYYDYR